MGKATNDGRGSRRFDKRRLGLGSVFGRAILCNAAKLASKNHIFGLVCHNLMNKRKYFSRRGNLESLGSQPWEGYAA